MDAKKNHFSLGSNLGFVLRGAAKYGRSAYALFALNALAASLLPFVAVLLPKVLVQAWRAGRSCGRCCSTPLASSWPA